MEEREKDSKNEREEMEFASLVPWLMEAKNLHFLSPLYVSFEYEG